MNISWKHVITSMNQFHEIFTKKSINHNTVCKLRNFTATIFSQKFHEINFLLKNSDLSKLIWRKKFVWQWISRFSTICIRCTISTSSKWKKKWILVLLEKYFVKIEKYFVRVFFFFIEEFMKTTVPNQLISRNFFFQRLKRVAFPLPHFLLAIGKN